jgi:hypothetical protein
MPDEIEKESRAKSKKAVKRKAAKETVPTTAKGTPWTFPKVTLEEAIRVPKAIEEKSAGNATPAAVIAGAVGFKPSDWRFTDLLRSANQYGLVTGSGAASTVHIAPLGLMALT